MGYIDPVTGVEINDPFVTGEPALTPPVYPDLPSLPQDSAPQAPPMATGGGYSETSFDPADAQRRIQFADAATAGMKDEDAAQLQGLYDSQMAALDTATALQKEGQEKVNKANYGVSEATRAGYEDLTTLSSQQAKDAAADEAIHTSEIMGAMSRWQESMARTTAMKVDPDRLMKNAGPTGRLGFAGAAFAEGFLGAKGIKVKAIDYIQDRINKDINAQLVDIEQGRETTAQFRALYDAARSNASDARDVRERLNAMYLQAATNKVQERIAGAQSQLELATGEKILADLGAAKAQAEAVIQENIVNKAQERRQFREEMRYKYATLAAVNREQDWRQSPLNPANAIKPVAGPAMIYAPAGVQGDQPVPVVALRPEFKDGPTANQLQTQVGDVSTMLDEARGLRDKLVDFNGRVYSGALGGLARDEEENAIRQEYLQWFNKYRKYLTGAAGSEVEDKRYAEAVPFPSFTGVNPKEAASAFNAYVLHGVKAADKTLSGFHDPHYGKYEGFAPAWQVEAEQYGKTTTQTTEGFRSNIMGDPGAVRPSPDKPGGDWQNYLKSFKLDSGFYKEDVPRGPGGGAYGPDKQPQWASVLDQRAAEAEAGDDLAKKNLWHSAHDTTIHPNRRAYAQYLLQIHPKIAPVTSDEEYNANLFE